MEAVGRIRKNGNHRFVFPDTLQCFEKIKSKVFKIHNRPKDEVDRILKETIREMRNDASKGLFFME